MTAGASVPTTLTKKSLKAWISSKVPQNGVASSLNDILKAVSVLPVGGQGCTQFCSEMFYMLSYNPVQLQTSCGKSTKSVACLHTYLVPKNA